MRKPTFILLLATIFGFLVTTVSLSLFFTEKKLTNAQTLPFFQKPENNTDKTERNRYAQNKPPIVASERSLPIPEHLSTLPRPDESPLFVERYAELIPEERISVQVYEQCNKSVVNIDTRTTYNMFLIGEIDEPGAGSGVVLDKEGHILTNSHVVSKVDSVMVAFFNGESYPATIVGEDPITDLAVLKVHAPAKDLYPVTLADSSRLLVGQKIFAIGNPFGLERTLTSGLISSLNRSIPSRIEARSIKGLIQIDAAINPGNSGGALLDTQGRMIGINTAIASQSGGSHGVGFAIPANTVSRIVPQLIKNGKVIRGEIGIGAVRVIEQDSVRGLLVRSLVPGGAAEKAGLKGPKVIRVRVPRGAFVIEGGAKIDWSVADIIVGVNGIETKKADDFTTVIDEHKPGDQIQLDVIRDGKRIRVPVILE
ncbi:MAG: trypsin-like peptidase domain-containing protein [Planctomycetaceae bacterium]|jgi:S1-C subfamily serine protease|nr:trypsin-like peptidase domain-containing protein [Planctomycetaceae bacterium]